MVAAGLASTGAATVTSVFNVAGTLIGAALTAMIITGGSAILRAYLESASSKVRSAPGKVRERVTRSDQRQDLVREEPPEPRQGFGERIVGAFRWFSHLSAFRQGAILRRALAGGAVAIVLGVGLVTAIEFGIGNSLSCSIWNECGTGASVAGTTTGEPASTRPSLLGGGQTATPDGTDQQVSPGQETPSGVDDESSPLPGGSPSGSEQPGQQQSPGNSGTPASGSDGQDAGGGTPSEPADPAQQPADGSGGSGTPSSGSGQPDGGAGGAEGDSQ